MYTDMVGVYTSACKCEVVTPHAAVHTIVIGAGATRV